jgi:hypothetical protein
MPPVDPIKVSTPFVAVSLKPIPPKPIADIIGSTRIAEKIGPLSMHRFLNRVFASIADPAADQLGEIRQ